MRSTAIGKARALAGRVWFWFLLLTVPVAVMLLAYRMF
jgi:hypothetical protein